MDTTTVAKPLEAPIAAERPMPLRVASIDALRGFVMLMMIFVNDISGGGSIVPDWMVHYHYRHTGSGLTFVDLVLPAFLFIVGMSIPVTLGQRIARGDSMLAIFLHVLTRTGGLLLISALMSADAPDYEAMRWGEGWWQTLMYASVICAFSSFGKYRGFTIFARGVGLGGLAYLSFAFIGTDGHRLITLDPFSMHIELWGILGTIGWTYLAGSLIFLIFRCNRTALLATFGMMFCMYAASRTDMFKDWPLDDMIHFGETFGTHSAIVVAGIFFASMVHAPEMVSHFARIRFGIWFIVMMLTSAFLLNGLYGIDKESASLSWALIACAVSAKLWLTSDAFCNMPRFTWLTRPFVIAGYNVLLAYLISEMLPSLLMVLGLGEWYTSLGQPNLIDAVMRSAVCAVAIMATTARLNYLGFRMKF